MSSTIFIILTIASAAVLIAAWMPEKAKRIFTGYQFIRNIALVIALFVVVPVLMGTGYLPAMAVGAGMIVVVIWGLWFGPLDEPDTPL